MLECSLLLLMMNEDDDEDEDEDAGGAAVSADLCRPPCFSIHLLSAATFF
jgi:hypothetical protein